MTERELIEAAMRECDDGCIRIGVYRTWQRVVVAENIRLLMSLRGVLQSALGQAMGVSQQYVERMLRTPYRGLSGAAVGRVAAALGVPVEWLSDPALAGRSVNELRGAAMSDRQCSICGGHLTDDEEARYHDEDLDTYLCCECYWELVDARDREEEEQ
jgi:transcriptional regulator with XRE-family HTH domain